MSFLTNSPAKKTSIDIFSLVLISAIGFLVTQAVVWEKVNYQHSVGVLIDSGDLGVILISLRSSTYSLRSLVLVWINNWII
jgi:hypothetical protein